MRVAAPALVLAQKLLPPTASLDVPLALAIVALAILIALTPSSIPGLTDVARGEKRNDEPHDRNP